mgnify:FL=1
MSASQEQNIESTTVDYPNEFKGFAVADPSKWNTPELISYQPKKLGEADVDIEIECNGICYSDLSVVKNKWMNDNHSMKCHTSKYGPKAQVVGHEIVGKIVKLGSNVKDLKLGQRVGVGAQCFACQKCDNCLNNNESYCLEYVGTYNGFYPDGYVSQGGYASHVRCSESMVFPIPDALDSKYVAPLLCGGLTVFSPIKRNVASVLAQGKTPNVGIIGIGGLGHMAIMIAKALGCTVTAFSRSYSKKEDAIKMGADNFIATGDDKTQWGQYKQTFDVLVNCASSTSALDLRTLLPTLKVNCNFVTVGLPSIDEYLKFFPFDFLPNGCGFAASKLGSKQEALEMLNLAVEKGFKPWVETLPISAAGVSEGLTRLDKGDVKYRFTLVGYNDFFGTGK